MAKNKFLSFLREFWLRITGESPAFFKVIQIIAGIVIFFAGIATILQGFTKLLPEIVNVLADWTILAGAIATYVVAKLPVVDKDRKVVDGDLPYTAAKIAEGKEPIH